MNSIKDLLDNNKRWSDEITRQNPHFFADLAEQQNPDYLWIGCSDSRVAANTIVGLMPGEVFVHRNVANLVLHTDLNCLSVMQFAIEVLEVDHVIVCGHYGCGGVKAAVDGDRHGMIDNWLRNIQKVANLHRSELDSFEAYDDRLDRLCELNVAQQVVNVGETTIMQDAWGAGRQVQVHGWIYGLKDGRIRDLDITISSIAELEELRARFSQQGRTLGALATPIP